ncbi:type III secretion system translocon subunit SctE [Enterobacter sp. 22466]|uniref:type III secretion system translocon subunit SctE n=1 Tax=Enterobacter sp. 22466 TaxID=3453924 RepID=UPI003F858658
MSIPVGVDPGSLNHLAHLFGHESASNNAVKTSNAAVKRFGDSRFAVHARGSDAKTMQETLTPEQLEQLLLRQSQSRDEQQPVGHLSGLGTLPRLATPAQKVPPDAANNVGVSAEDDSDLTSDARLMALLGKIAQMTSNNSIQKTIDALKNLNLQNAAVQKEYSALAKALEADGKALAHDKEEYQKDKDKYDGMTDKLQEAENRVAQDQASLTDLESQAKEYTVWGRPVPEALQRKISLAKEGLFMAKAKVSSLQGQCDKFKSDTLEPALKAVNASQAKVDADIKASQKLISSLSSQQLQVVTEKHKATQKDAASLTYLMALMNQLINQSASENLKAQADLNKKLQEASAKDAEQKAKDFAAKEAKAAETQKTMGCIGKIIGWVITAVSFAAAAFTGGASLALAAVGLALAVGDAIDQAVTGHSFMQDALKPVMDAVVKPLMNFFSNMMTNVLETFGVDKAEAEKVGKILGAIMAAVAVLAAVAVAGSVVKAGVGAAMDAVAGDVAESVAGSVTSDVAEEVGENVTKEAVEEVGEEVAEQAISRVAQQTEQQVAQETMEEASQGLMRKLMSKAVDVAKNGLAKDNETLMKVGNHMQTGVSVMTTVNTAAQAGAGIYVAQLRKEASKDEAGLMQDMANQELLKTLMDVALKVFASKLKTTSAILQDMSAATHQQTQVGMFITNQISRGAVA